VTVAVTGSTGELGGRVARRLAGLEHEQRLVVRDPARAPDLPGVHVRQTAGYHDGDSMREALEGAATLLLVPAAEAPDRVQQHLTAVDAARDAGVGRIVYLSFVNAAPDATFTLARHHWATEEHIRSAGVPFTFVRMSMYMDFIPLFAGEDDVIRGPAGDGRVGAILRDDVADVCVAVLTADGHEGATYTVTGPRAITLGEMAAELSRAQGREIRYEHETVEEAWASRAGLGAPDWEVGGWISSYTAIASGELDVVTDDVERLTGRGPTDLADWLGA
jgi:NAD(P)H dehydrogenase (quinone)